MAIYIHLYLAKWQHKKWKQWKQKKQEKAFRNKNVNFMCMYACIVNTRQPVSCPDLQSLLSAFVRSNLSANLSVTQDGIWGKRHTPWHRARFPRAIRTRRRRLACTVRRTATEPCSLVHRVPVTTCIGLCHCPAVPTCLPSCEMFGQRRRRLMMTWPAT